MEKRPILHFFEEKARKIEHSRYYESKSSLRRRVYKKWLSKVLEQAQESSGDFILDVGCGDGFLALELATIVETTCALDISSVRLRRTQESAKENEISIFLVHGDAQYLPFRSCGFDSIVCNSVLPYLQDPGKTLSEARRVLKQSGVMVVGVENRLNLYNLVDRLLNPNKRRLLGRRREFDVNSLYRITASAELKPINMKGIGVFELTGLEGTAPRFKPSNKRSVLNIFLFLFSYVLILKCSKIGSSRRSR